jgi:hypothetical protein
MTGRPLYYPSPRLKRDLERNGAPSALPINATIGIGDVRRIATRGFPLKEDVPTLQLRNQRVTLAYHSLGKQLSDLIAASHPNVRVANWCTFAAWSSKTIGATISPDEHPPAVPKRIRFKRQIVKFVQWTTRRNHGAIFRSLAAGNRFIFLEVGLAAAEFIKAFTDAPISPKAIEGDTSIPETLTQADVAELDRRREQWAEFWSGVEDSLVELKALDPSWVPSQAGDPELLRVGMRLYFDALYEPNDNRCSELVLAANLYIGAYEQFRADGYVVTSFAIRGEAAFRRLLLRGTGRSGNPIRRLAVWIYSMILTRFGLALLMPNEIIKIGRPLRPPMMADGKTRRRDLFAGDVQTIEEPRLQALLSRYDFNDIEAEGHRKVAVTRRRAKNWLDYHERMHYIANLFRAFHNDPDLLSRQVFEDRHADELRAGRLPLIRPRGDIARST